jgi:carboxypeptidase Q
MRGRGVALAALVVGSCAALSLPVRAQTFPVDDPVLERIWALGMDSSRVEELAQALTDSIGPRLTGSPQLRAAQRWILSRYEAWGIAAREERYGTWKGWRRGYTHVDLIAPRVRTLEGTMMAFSAGTKKPVEGDVIVLPLLETREAFERWLPAARGKFVLTAAPEPSCRPDDADTRWATPAVRARLQRQRDSIAESWSARLLLAGVDNAGLQSRLEAAGAAGILWARWSRGWGVDRLFGTDVQRVPVVQLSCEDYGLVFRLAERGQGPRLRLDARSQSLGEVPVFNVLGELRGREKPDEYVMLSAHLDTWDGASGATDNATGTVMMMEAMRLLKAVLPSPRRTILVGHWAGEEQGLNGSRAFVQDHPDVVGGVQVLLNQDNGTGRVTRIAMHGFTEAGGFFARWLARIPVELSSQIELDNPGRPTTGGSDHSAFLCAGAPAFRLSAEDHDYNVYTWHTTRDTYDKVVPENVRQNAVLTAMLAYLASEDPERVPRDQRLMTANGDSAAWPTCRAPRRSSSEPRAR